jgi:hypothetical protein
MRLPGRSGMSSVASSRMQTNPGGSPRGLTSQLPAVLQRVLEEAKWRKRMTDADMRALSPLVYAHVNPYGLFELDVRAPETGVAIIDVASDDGGVENSDPPDDLSETSGVMTRRSHALDHGPEVTTGRVHCGGGKTGRERRCSGAALALTLDSTGSTRAPAGSCARLRCGSLVGPGGDAALPALPCMR